MRWERIVHASQEHSHDTDMMHKLQSERQEFVVGVGPEQPVVDHLEHTKAPVNINRTIRFDFASFIIKPGHV